MPYIKKRYFVVIDSTINKLMNSIYSKVSDLNAKCYKTKEPVSYENRTNGEYINLSVGDKWGDLWDCAWFHFNGEVPECARGKEVVAYIDVSGEGLIVDSNGNPLRGITVVEGVYDEIHGLGGKKVYLISENSTGNEKIDFWMDCGCNSLFGKMKNNGILAVSHIAIRNNKIRDLFYDFQVLNNLMHTLDEKSARYNSLLFALYNASLELNDFTDDEIERASKILKKELDKKGGDPSLNFTAIGHAHLDLAWLWPIRETIRKGARTFSTVLDLMDKYPDYKFGASQAQLFEWMKTYYPDLYSRVKQKIKEGRFEVQGATWVESDTNLTSGESLVRQILYGKKFYKEEFGIDVKNLWLPDAFGYSGALPQILKKSGCGYFMTQKLSWNEHNKFPHQTFTWVGIDSSEVFAHMLPEEIYNSPVTPEAIHMAEYNYFDSGMTDEALILFGIGDGGGGPGLEHLERLKRIKDLNGLSPVTQGFAQPCLERIESKSQKRQRYIGELYLEKHQGTLTTQSKNKWYNRKMELALRELEYSYVCSDCKNYNKNELDKIWKEVLLYQFHDILPGSSIKRVYDESLARYEILLKRVEQLTNKNYELISPKDKIIAFNSLPWDREDFIKVGNEYLYVKIPSMGSVEAVTINNEHNINVQENVIENQFIRVEFSSDGCIISLFDKVNNRESLSDKSNTYTVYQDENADCWDIGLEYTDRKPKLFTLLNQKFYVNGPYAYCVQNYEYNLSKMTVTIRLSEISKRVEFNVDIDWNESFKMLRVNFETNIVANYASYEIQFGKIDRKNNDNTLIEKAQFEVCGHKWVDLSEQNYGFSLLTESKYGYRVKEKHMDINLLRSQNYPGENADKGHHNFSYAVYPHKGNCEASNVSRQAYEFNIQPHVVIGSCNEPYSMPTLSITDKIMIEAVKPAEDLNGIIVRMYEPYGSSINAQLSYSKSNCEAYECDLLENNISRFDFDGVVKLSFKPFEIKTVRLV